MAQARTEPGGCRSGLPTHRLQALVEAEIGSDACSSREVERRRGSAEQELAAGVPPDGSPSRTVEAAGPAAPGGFAPRPVGQDLGAVLGEVARVSAAAALAPTRDVAATVAWPPGGARAGRAVASDDIAALDRVVNRIYGAGLLLQAAMRPTRDGDAVEEAVLELDHALEELRLAVASGAGRRRKRWRPAGRP